MAKEPTAPSGQDIRRVYGEIALQYRYFQSWRQGLFAGYLVSLAALAVAASWIFGDARHFIWLVPPGGLILTLLFWALDRRNRDLYHACQECGSAMENHYFDSQGIFTKLETNRGRHISHSAALDCFFGAMVLVFVSSIVWMVCAWETIVSPGH